MKKFMTSIVAIVAILSLSLICLTGCGSESGVQGTYKVQSMTMKMGEQEEVVNLGDEYEEGYTLTEDTFIIKIKSDGVASQTSPDGTIDGTWVADADNENKLTITFAYSADNSEVYNAVIDGKTMTIVIEEYMGPGSSLTYVLEK